MQEGMRETADLERVLAFERRMWNVQRFGLSAAAAFLLACLLGLIGGGPISRRVVHDGGVTLEFDRFGRFENPTSLRITLPARGLHEVGFMLDSTFLNEVEAEHISPEPRDSILDDRGTLLTFSVNPGAAGVSIYVSYRPKRSGMLNGSVIVSGGARFPIRTFVYP